MLPYIETAAFLSIIFLTLRDIRIFRRTKIESYRRGALKGILASAVALLGILYSSSLGLILVAIALYLNIKGPREDVFGDLPAWKRFLGETERKP
jgi:hypothetical protein